MPALRTAIFAYNFEHKKTYEGLLRLHVEGVKPSCILAADAVPLTFYQSKTRISPKDLRYPHPSHVARVLGIPYHVVDHKGDEAVSILKHHACDLGIILGARILPRRLIDAFKIGILNLHPGLIPENRGLDNIKWAVLRGMPQGATAHLITEAVDLGPIIERREVRLFQDDTLLDVFLRVQNLEQDLMVAAIRALESGKRTFQPPDHEGEYFRAVPPELEAKLGAEFENYKRRFASEARA